MIVIVEGNDQAAIASLLATNALKHPVSDDACLYRLR